MANIITDYCISPDGFMQIVINIEINSGKYEIFRQCRTRGAGLRKILPMLQNELGVTETGCKIKNRFKEKTI